MADMTELLSNADVCLIEISHEVDTRLLEFTKLKREWFQQLGKYLKEISFNQVRASFKITELYYRRVGIMLMRVFGDISVSRTKST